MKKNTVKKIYSKPQLKQVKLLPEEAVLSNCKAVAGSGGAKKCNCATGSLIGS